MNNLIRWHELNLVIIYLCSFSSVCFWLIQAEFIRRYIPADVKIILIGHSIGSYMSIELLKFEDINRRIQHAYFLFPTFEYMADTPNGKLLTNFLGFQYRLVDGLAKMLTYIPTVVLAAFITVFMWCRSMPLEFLDSMLMHFRPSVLSKVVFLAADEMQTVLAPDYKTIEENKQRLSFIYSANDKWAPITYYERLIARIPDIDAQLTDEFTHAFVLKSSHDMAGSLAGRILERARNA